MKKAEEYNLHFSTYEFNNTTIPSVGCSLVNGSSKNNEIASFLEPNGIRLTQQIIDDITSLNLDLNIPFEGYNIWGGNQDESVEIKSPPFRAVFNTTGKPVEVPISDFLQILQEWKAFLQTIPNPNWLYNR
ncbi:MULTISPECIES: hypothetical protein [Flavobacterium]|uniref:Uncharacterized protein n=1 Tax=Flavobacterium ginsengisoli TaxID=871694 RepID=A0ABP7FE10_9FLAO|nr:MULTISPECIES: hypothetical protein [Flavobacterium]MBJ2125344.1 hypothetical protein [Flavobacterium sp. IB48]